MQWQICNGYHLSLDRQMFNVTTYLQQPTTDVFPNCNKYTPAPRIHTIFRSVSSVYIIVKY